MEDGESLGTEEGPQDWVSPVDYESIVRISKWFFTLYLFNIREAQRCDTASTSDSSLDLRLICSGSPVCFKSYIYINLQGVSFSLFH